MSDDDLNVGLEVFKGFSGKIIQGLIGFVGTIIFARILGPTSFGAFYFLQSIVFLVDRPVRGTGQALTKRLSEEDTPDREVVGAGVFIAGVVTLLFSPTVLLNAWLTSLTGVQDAGFVFMALLASISFFFVAQRLLEGYGLVGARVWNDTVRSVVTLAAQLAFVLAGFGAAGLGYGLAVATAVSVVIGFAVLGTRPTQPSARTVRSIWTFARFSIPESFVGKVYHRIDTLILGFFTTTAWVGYYEVGLKLSIPATFLASMVSSVLFPKVSKLDSAERDVSDDTQNAISYTSIFAIPMLFGVLVFPKKLVVTVYGGDYALAAPFVVGIVLVQLLNSQVNVYMSTLRGMDLPNISLYVSLAGLLVNAVVAIGTLLYVGPLGVVVGSVVAEATQYRIASSKVRERVDVARIPRPLLEQIAAGGVMFVVLEVITQVVSIPSFVHLLAVIGGGAVIYVVMLYTISDGFRVTIRSVLKDLAVEYV